MTSLSCEETLNAVREAWPAAMDEGTGLCLDEDGLVVHFHPLGDDRTMVFAEIRELDGGLDGQAMTELAFESLETTDDLLDEGPFSVAVDGTRQFMQLQWLIDGGCADAEALRLWLPQFVSCAKRLVGRVNLGSAVQ